MRDDEWVEDRRQGSGGAFTRESMQEGRAWCLSQLRIYFGIVESMLADGRQWIWGDGPKPGLADIHACWMFDWAINMADDMFIAEEEQAEAVKDAKAVLNEAEFPKIYAWVRRFRKACDEGTKVNRVTRLEGEPMEQEVVARIVAGDLVEPEDLIFEENDVLRLYKGQAVSIGPADFGFTHLDKGQLVGLTSNEVVIATTEGGKGLRLHFPRVNFKIHPL